MRAGYRLSDRDLSMVSSLRSAFSTSSKQLRRIHGSKMHKSALPGRRQPAARHMDEATELHHPPCHAISCHRTPRWCLAEDSPPRPDGLNAETKYIQSLSAWLEYSCRACYRGSEEAILACAKRMNERSTYVGVLPRIITGGRDSRRAGASCGLAEPRRSK